MDLRGYEHTKFALAELLRTATEQEPQDGDFEERSKDLFARLAEDRFYLMIAGRFNRGKASLMNAIMGVDRLPTAICLPHLKMPVGEIKDKDVRGDLIERQAVLLERISEDMQRYSIKHNAVRRLLASKEEETAARRAIHIVSGRQSVNFNQAHEGLEKPTGSVDQSVHSRGEHHNGENEH